MVRLRFGFGLGARLRTGLGLGLVLELGLGLGLGLGPHLVAGCVLQLVGHVHQPRTTPTRCKVRGMGGGTGRM